MVNNTIQHNLGFHGSPQNELDFFIYMLLVFYAVFPQKTENNVCFYKRPLTLLNLCLRARGSPKMNLICLSTYGADFLHSFLPKNPENYVFVLS